MRKPVRTTAAAAGLVAALALTGCGGGSDDAGKDDKASASPTEAGGDGGGKDADRSRDIEGTWTGVSDGKPVALSVKDGNAAILADGHACTGEVQDMGKQMLALKCADGNTDRTMGAIESNDGTTLVISWDAGKKDTLRKSAAGEPPDDLPTGLPTEFQAP